MTGAMDPVATPELPSLGGSLAVSMLSLGLVCLLAWVLLRWMSRRGVGQGMGPVKVLARCPIEPKRSVYLIEAGGRCFLVGAGDGAMNLLAEIDPKSLEQPERQAVRAGLFAGAIPRTRFAEVLARLMNATRVASAANRRSGADAPAGTAVSAVTAVTAVTAMTGSPAMEPAPRVDPDPT